MDTFFCCMVKTANSTPDRVETCSPAARARDCPSPGRTPESRKEVAGADAQDIAQVLLAWFRRHGRDLPWRRAPRTPYRVLVSEMMLQQTRADVVAGRFEAFLHRYPDFAALARAPLADVLRAWEGLGYYRRAEALWRAAGLIAARGGMPSDREELLRLPGIGPYSASAVRSFAFSLPDAALDANLRRVALRLLGDPADPGKAGGQAVARAFLQDVLAAGPADTLSDALMDLGATVCTARRPRCDACPLADACAAYRSGAPEAIGRSAARPARRELRIVVLRVESEAGMLWRPRPGRGLLAGLWEPPHALGGEEPDDAAIAAVLEEWGIAAARDSGERWPMAHAFTHQIWTGEVRRLTASPAPPKPPARWLDAQGLAAVALPRAFRAVLTRRW